jgi:hypothetical protein
MMQSPRLRTLLLSVGNFLFCSILSSQSVIAAPLSSSLNSASEPSDPMAQINMVADLSDVQSSDWAFQALMNLRDRYNLQLNYPSGTFRGNRSLSRLEFAAALNAAIDHMNQLQSTTNQFARKRDLETLKQLQAAFARELESLTATLPEARTEQLERQSFSTTTKLNGEVIIAAVGVNRTNRADDEDEQTDSNLAVGSRIRLSLETSFTGRDRLLTRLQTNNIPRTDDATGTNMARLAFQGSNNTAINVSRLGYTFPLGEQTTVYLTAVGGGLNDFVNIANPFLRGSGRGSISRFGQRNPIYRQGRGAGIGVMHEFNQVVSLSLGYLASDANEPERGLGGGAYGAIAQLLIEPRSGVDIGLTYIRSYNNLATGTGSNRANDPFNDESDAIAADSFGLQSTFRITRQVVVGGWVGFSRAQALDLPGNPSADVFNWAATLAFPDLGRKGNLLGVLIGSPPKVIRNRFEISDRENRDQDTSLHLETFYRFRVIDNVIMTVGLLAITHPEHDRNNQLIYVGTIRTTFSF